MTAQGAHRAFRDAIGWRMTLSGQGTDTVSKARLHALRALLRMMTATTSRRRRGVMVEALITARHRQSDPDRTLPPVHPPHSPFRPLNTSLAQQLKQVARLIDARTVTGVKRQFFFVSLGGFDTHSNTVTNQTNLFNQLAPAMKAFYDYTVAAGISANVTTFTMSDFSRTFIGNSNAGVDHAWGAHHLVLGGAVRSGAIYGTLPQLVVKGNDDAGSNGSWIPTTYRGPDRRHAGPLVRRARYRPRPDISEPRQFRHDEHALPRVCVTTSLANSLANSLRHLDHDYDDPA